MPQQVDAKEVVGSVMDRLPADLFMDRLLAAHQAEDAFVSVPEDVGEEE